jgi:hypothetical protein
VIFGAWLMQKADLHEKQVVLLTRENSISSGKALSIPMANTLRFNACERWI